MTMSIKDDKTPVHAAASAIVPIKPEEVAALVQTAPQALQFNRTSKTKAEEVGKQLLERIDKAGMSDALDIDANKYLVKVRLTVEKMNEQRKPLTQILQAIAKEFTSLEAALEPENKNGIYYKVQQHRNAWAARKAADAKRIQEEADKKLRRDKEVVNTRVDAEKNLRQYFDNYYNNKRQGLTDLINRITLESFDADTERIRSYPSIYPVEHFDSFVPNIMTVYLSSDELNEIVAATRIGKFKEFATIYETGISELKASCIDRLPGKKRNLEELATANAARKAELEKVEKERQERETAARLKQEEDTRKRLEQEAEVKRTTGTTEILFNNHVELSAIPQQKAQVRESYEIIVINPLGWLSLMQFWMEKEGRNQVEPQQLEKLEKKTLASVKKFCESWALKEGNEMIQSPYLRYQEKFKAVATAK